MIHWNFKKYLKKQAKQWKTDKKLENREMFKKREKTGKQAP